MVGLTRGVQRTRDSCSVSKSDALGPAPLTPVVRRMRRCLQQRFVLAALAASFVLLGCETSPVTKPHDRGRAVKASPDLERFLISHGFHREASQIYTRHYESLQKASEDLGVSLVNLPIPPNGTFLEVHDERVFSLHAWGFTVLAEKGRTLDDSSTPCTVSTSLIQVR